MTSQSIEESREILMLSPSEREQQDLSAAEVRDALLTVIADGGKEAKVFEACTIPELDLDHHTIESANTHPIVFRNCSFPDGWHAVQADFKVPLNFEECTIAGFELDGARFEYDVAIEGSTVTRQASGHEARFEQDADFTGTRFEAPVELDEAAFADDLRFDATTLTASASFEAAKFAGTSNALDDNASFDEATFERPASFQQASFKYASFEGASWEEPVNFEEVVFDGDARFAECTFDGEADYDEARFKEDVSFEGTTFAAEAIFRGVTVEGGARTLQDDASFEETTFDGPANFRDAQFRSVNFEAADFTGHAMFEEARFEDDAHFQTVSFAGEADFDEARFFGDAEFSAATFHEAAVFRGARFEGEAEHLAKNAVFEGVHFETDADFDNAAFTSANFRETSFGGLTDFTGAEFTDEIDFKAEAVADDTFVDFTDAILKEGTITQPAQHWVRYDFTKASLGDIALEAERKGGHREILDYFRICNTEFDEFDGYEFDFSAHTYYLDRNDWNLHTFNAGTVDREYALEMTPANIETTYLKAKKAASAGGYVKAAGEFRVQRQRHARRKHLSIARDTAAATAARISNASRAVENYFLDLTCGYGMRLGRILAVFLAAPLLPGLLYAFGGAPFRTGAGQIGSLGALAGPPGQAILFKNVYFSYITFLTIGYGGIGPQGALARILAALEVYLSVILGGLVLYALIKRSEL